MANFIIFVGTSELFCNCIILVFEHEVEHDHVI